MRTESALPWLAALLLAGCAGYRAPDDFLPTVDQAPLAVHGGWASATLRTDGFVRHRVEGECVAVSADSLFLQPLVGRQRGLAWTELKHVRVEGYRVDTGDLPWLTSWGVVQSVGLGWWGLFGLPIWALGSSSISWELHKHDRRVATAEQWETLRPWCRFPQGLPPGNGIADGVPTLPMAVGTLPGDFQPGPPTQPLSPSLPGAWLKGTFKPGQAPGQQPEDYLLTKIVAGLLVAVRADSLYLWADSLRAVARSQLRSARLYRREPSTGRLVKVGRIWNDGSLEPARLAWLPQGLPGGSRRALEDSLHQELTLWRSWLQQEARWLEP